VIAHWASLGVAICISVAGQLLLKAGAVGDRGVIEQVLRWQTLVGLCCYGAASVFYILAIRRIPISVAMPMVAVSYALIAVLGHMIWNEPMTLLHVAGITLVCGGVVVLAFAAASG
jgi:multidrug transporter EmrE-like cation transporter